MSDSSRAENLLTQLDQLNAQQLRRLLVEHLTKLKLGLYWEANAIERDAALNADLVLPRLVEEWSHAPSPLDPLPPAGEGGIAHRNLIRPDTLREQLAARGVEANCYSLMDVLLSGQRGSAA